MKEALEKVLLEEIPLTRAMGLRVVEAGASKVILSAPLEPNHNHKQTVFGGSLYSLAVLSGWSLLWVRMQEAGLQGHIVIASSDVQYLKPVLTDFRATAEADGESLDVAMRIFKSKGRARAMLSSRIGPPEDPGVRFMGTYALVP